MFLCPCCLAPKIYLLIENSMSVESIKCKEQIILNLPDLTSCSRIPSFLPSPETTHSSA